MVLLFVVDFAWVWGIFFFVVFSFFVSLLIVWLAGLRVFFLIFAGFLVKLFCFEFCSFVFGVLLLFAAVLLSCVLV